MVRFQALISRWQMLSLLYLLTDWLILGLSFGHGNAEVQCGWPTPLQNDASPLASPFSPGPSTSTTLVPERLQWYLRKREHSMSAQNPASRLCTASFHPPSLWGPGAQTTASTVLALAPSLPSENPSKDKKHTCSPLHFVESIHRTNLKWK